MRCPICKSIEHLCEEVNLEYGEVIGYHCTACGFDSEEVITVDEID